MEYKPFREANGEPRLLGVQSWDACLNGSIVSRQMMEGPLARVDLSGTRQLVGGQVND